MFPIRVYAARRPRLCRRHGSFSQYPTCLMLLILLLTSASLAPAETVDRLNEDQQREMEHLLEDLRDGNLDMERRRRAAQILLTRDWPDATQAMKLDLARGTVGTRRAVAKAIAAVDQPDPDLMQPLVNLLDTEETALRRDVAAGLGRFDDEGLVRWLMQVAEEGGESSAERLGAIESLAQHRQTEVVELLLSLIEPDHAWAVRSAAFDSLARLSGLHALGTDVESWQQWWARASSLEADQWQSSLLRNFSNRNAELAKQVQVSVDRLVTAHNRLYDAAAESGRPAMLEQMLRDPMEDLRLLALRLIERRVLNAQPVEGEVRAAMRQCLTDRAAAVRIKSATVLETLADAEAAELAIDLLLAERSRSVQSAYLTLMARVPRAEAVEPALWLMQEQRVQSAAADCLRAAFDAGLMLGPQIQRARQITRRHFADEEAETDRAMLRLLSHIGQEEDLEILVAHLEHEDPAVRLTAARGFRREHWPLEPLLAVLSESDLAPVVMEVAEQRGQKLVTVEHLLANEPESSDVDLLAAWEESLGAVASRLSAEAVVQLDGQLGEKDRPELHARLLKAAAALESGDWDNGLAGGRIEAALRLARLQTQSEEFEAAEAVYDRLATRSSTLSIEQRKRLALGRTAVLLHQGKVEAAAVLNATVLEEKTATADDLIVVWLKVVEDAIVEGDDSAATRLMVEKATELFEEAGEAHRAKLGALREQLDATLGEA
ncbi:MAG: HEAT repeat domain-containing protein [Phycisphaeraceae bacterium]